MKNKVPRHVSIMVLIGMIVLLTVRARAQTPGTTEDFANAVVTLSAGQTLRVSVINPLPPPAPGEDARKFKMLFAVTIFDDAGGVLARSAEITLNPGQFHSFDFHRANLPSPGGTDTTPLQLRSEIRRLHTPFPVPIRIVSADLNVLVELIDSFTGQTQLTTYLAPGVLLSRSDFQVQVLPPGLMPGQTLRVNVASTSSPRQYRTLRPRVMLNDANGNLLASSGELVILPGQFRSYDFPRDALPIVGEDPTGRVQVSATIFLNDDDMMIGRSDSVSVSLELVAESTGRTIGLLLPAVQTIRCASRNC